VISEDGDHSDVSNSVSENADTGSQIWRFAIPRLKGGRKAKAETRTSAAISALLRGHALLGIRTIGGPSLPQPSHLIPNGTTYILRLVIN
jgi:hypothetical protein